MKVTTIDQADELSRIALDAVRELKEELQDGELDRALAAMDAEDNKRRKVVDPEEFYGDHYPNVLPPYEAPKEYQR